MSEVTFSATGTEWWICCELAQLLPRAEALVRALEQRLSRFLPDSSLSRLNRDRHRNDAQLADVVRTALRMRTLSGGAFDPTLGRELSELGYDRTYRAVGIVDAKPPRPRQQLSLSVVVEGADVQLIGEGELDLGGVAKGFIVDRVAEMLIEEGSASAVVDGGGDIRVVGGPWPIEYGDGRVVVLESEAIATSSVRRRRWSDAAGRELHHIVDPATGAPACPVADIVTIRAADAALADAFATAAIVNAQLVFGLLEQVGAEAAAEDALGRWWTTPGWEETR